MSTKLHYKLTWQDGKAPTDDISTQVKLVEEQQRFEMADGITWYKILYLGDEYFAQIECA
jgi:hypothetical protein